MTGLSSADLARRLSAHAEAVCEVYLSNGRKAGRYWLVGDVYNTKGQSLHVRLTGPSSGPGAAGKWSDEATGEHGDLLDLIRINRGLDQFHDLREEVLRFLSEPASLTKPVREKVPPNSRAAAQRLFAMAKPADNSLVATYLASRGIVLPSMPAALRFHPTCYYRPDRQSLLQQWPANLAALTDGNGAITGILRTYLACDGQGKAPLSNPRLAMGELLGHAVRFDAPDDALVLGEGLETVLSVKCALPELAAAAALTANHMRAFILPAHIKRLYLAADNDTPGLAACDFVQARAEAAGLAVIKLLPHIGDWNDVLRAIGQARLRSMLLPQLHAEDRASANA